MSTINEIFETFQNRVKSPVFGSVVFSFLVWNWKAVLFLAFETNASMVQRFQYFENETNRWDLFFWPLLFGVTLALVLPFVNLLASRLIKWPVQELRMLGIRAASERDTEKQKLARLRRTEEAEHDKDEIEKRERREKEILERAKRDQEAALEIQDKKIRDEYTANVDYVRQVSLFERHKHILGRLDIKDVEKMIDAAKDDKLSPLASDELGFAIQQLFGEFIANDDTDAAAELLMAVAIFDDLELRKLSYKLSRELEKTIMDRHR